MINFAFSLHTSNRIFRNHKISILPHFYNRNNGWFKYALIWFTKYISYFFSYLNKKYRNETIYLLLHRNRCTLLQKMLQWQMWKGLLHLLKIEDLIHLYIWYFNYCLRKKGKENRKVNLLTLVIIRKYFLENSRNNSI